MTVLLCWEKVFLIQLVGNQPPSWFLFFIIWIQPEKYAAVSLKLQITSEQHLLNNNRLAYYHSYHGINNLHNAISCCSLKTSLVFPDIFFIQHLYSHPCSDLPCSPCCQSPGWSMPLFSSWIGLTLKANSLQFRLAANFCENLASTCVGEAGSHPETHKVSMHVCTQRTRGRVFLYLPVRTSWSSQLQKQHVSRKLHFTSLLVVYVQFFHRNS